MEIKTFKIRSIYFPVIEDRLLFFEFIFLFVFIFSLPFSETLKTISFVSLFGTFVLHRILKKDVSLFLTPFSFGLLIYLLSGLFISFFAVDFKESMKGWLDIFTFSSVYFILVNDFRLSVFKRFIESCLIFSTFLGVVWGIIFWKLLWHKSHLQIISLGYYNHTSIFLGLVLILNFCKIVWDSSLSSRSRTFFFITFIFLIIGLILTTSRASVLGVACSVLFLLIYKINDKRILKVFILFCLISVFSFLISKDFQKRLFNIGPVISRIHIWQAGLRAFRDRPLVGYGLRCFGEIDAKYYGKFIRDRVDHAHNLFINHLTQMGVLGFVALLYWLYTTFLTARFSEDNYRKYAVYSALVFVVVNGIFNTTLRWEHAIAFVILVYLLDFKGLDS